MKCEQDHPHQDHLRCHISLNKEAVNFVEVNHEAYFTNLMKLNQIGDMPVRVSPHPSQKYAKAVVRFRHAVEGLANEEHTRHLNMTRHNNDSPQLKETSRVIITKGGKKVQTATFYLTFDAPTLSEHLINRNLTLSDGNARLREVITTLCQDNTSLRQRLDGYEQRLKTLTLEQSMVCGAHPDILLVGIQNTISLGRAHKTAPVGNAHRPSVSKANIASWAGTGET